MKYPITGYGIIELSRNYIPTPKNRKRVSQSKIYHSKQKQILEIIPKASVTPYLHHKDNIHLKIKKRATDVYILININYSFYLFQNFLGLFISLRPICDQFATDFAASHFVFTIHSDFWFNGQKPHIYAQKITVPTAPMSVKTVIVSARSGVRTLDTLIKSQVLYQLS